MASNDEELLIRSKAFATLFSGARRALDLTMQFRMYDRLVDEHAIVIQSIPLA